MKIEGTKTISQKPEQAFQLLTDPAVLRKVIPGLQQFKTIRKNKYNATVELGIPGVKGRYQLTMELKNLVVNKSYRLVMNGDGPLGKMMANVNISLKEKGKGTLVSYAGDASVDGGSSSLGKKVLPGVIKVIVGQFFSGVAKQASASK